MITIQTPRLLLRPFRDTDIESYAAMCGDPEVMRYLGDRVVLSREDAWRQMAMLMGHWSLRGFGSWAIEERLTGNFLGRVGLHYPDGWPDREVNWALARKYWGKSFAFEGAQAALAHAFNSLDWERATSLIDSKNQRSIRLAERLGERFEKDVELGGFRLRLYSIDRAAWRAVQPIDEANGPISK